MDLICYVPTRGEPWCIIILETLLDSIISWYHQILSHIGMTRLYNTILVHFYYQSLKTSIETYIQSCDTCQCTKLPGMGYSHLPPQDTLIACVVQKVDGSKGRRGETSLTTRQDKGMQG